jgi:hypothetical protein
MDLQETEAHQAYQDLQDQWELEAHRDPRESAETQDFKERKVLRDLLDCRVLQDPWAHEENEERKAVQDSLDPLDWEDDLETKVHLGLLEAWDHLALLVFLGHQARPDLLVQQAREGREVQLDRLVLLDPLA